MTISTPPTFLALALASALSCAHAQSDGAGVRMSRQQGVEGVTDRLIVKYKSRNDLPFSSPRAEAALRVAANRQGVNLSHLRVTAHGAQVFRLSRRMSHGEAAAMAASVRAGDGDVEYAEPDQVLHATFTPNDALYGQQWSLFDTVGGIRAPAAWDRAKGTGVVVAVVDTGVRKHADLAANLLPGFDFIGDTVVSNDGNGRDGDASDPGDAAPYGYCGSGSPASNSSWHGTHVSGIVAATGQNAAGITGVAFGAKVLPLRVLGRCGGYMSDIADAVSWAAGNAVAGIANNANPARVINLSLGGGGACGTTMQGAINAARAKGAVVVVAAGNDNGSALNSTPANCAGVVTVAATGKGGGRASYSNTGSNVALAAPGGDSGAGILSTLNTGSAGPGADHYAAYMGTSMATPVVSAVAALMLSVNPKLTPDQVAALLKGSARAFPAPCPACGAGLVDANAAVAAALAATGAPAPAPAPKPAPSPAPAPAPSPAPAPAPAPAPGGMREVEPNNTLATAQLITSLPAALAGATAPADQDYAKFNLPAKRKVLVTLTPSANTAMGLGVVMTHGVTLAQVAGTAGGRVQITVTNGGTAAVNLATRAYFTAGGAGTYSLAFALQ